MDLKNVKRKEKKGKKENLVSRNERFSEKKDWVLGLEV